MSVIGLGNSVNKYLDLVLQRSSVTMFKYFTVRPILKNYYNEETNGTADFTKEHQRNFLDLKYYFQYLLYIDHEVILYFLFTVCADQL